MTRSTISPLSDGTSPTSRETDAIPFAETAFAFVAVLWLGFLLGVSFLATPVKFQAPSLDLPTALDVGRVTFALFSMTEWALCALLLVALVISPWLNPWRWVSIAVLAAILAVQALWLLPVLDARVGIIIAGGTVPATSHHLFYIAADILKALLLSVLGVEALRRLVRRREIS